jgi:hypothetical protein
VFGTRQSYQSAINVDVASDFLVDIIIAFVEAFDLEGANTFWGAAGGNAAYSRVQATRTRSFDAAREARSVILPREGTRP